MDMKWKKRAILGVGLLVLAIPLGSHAINYPSKPIRFIVAFPPGGPADLMARATAQRLQESLKQPVIVDNRPGASGIIGTEALAKAPPDGHTILMTSTGHSVNATLYKTLPYDPVRDFSPVVAVAATPLVVVAGPGTTATSFKELVAFARMNPGKLSYGSGGSGTLTHLAPEFFKLQTGIDMIHVPYKGVGPMLTDLIGGQVSIAFDTLVTSMPQIRAGKLRALAVTSIRRSPLLPDVPTVSESDPALKGFDAVGWFGILAPAGTSSEIISILNREVIKALELPDVRERFLSLGAQALGGSPQDFAKLIQTEILKWGAVVKATGAQAD
jgi:tripartite-type tricarboxylate transporter receptor subunit TctC